MLHERACALCGDGREVLMWTFDKGLQRRVLDSTAEARSVRGATGGTVRFLRGEPLALLDSPRPEWRDVARHPLGGGGIEDLLTGKQAGSAPTTTRDCPGCRC